MGEQCIDKLKGPELVMRVQRFFGIESREASSGEIAKDGQPQLDYKIGNRFWYFLFILGTELGDETFYAAFIPFWFWNVDGAVGRRFVFVWAAMMYVGQALKDVIRWPRPGPPSIKLQKKWVNEYGMPSTHAMVGISIPFSILLYTKER